MIVHIGCTHKVLRIAISVRETSPSHCNEISVNKGAIHLKNDHVLVNDCLSSESGLEHRFILDLPIEVVNGLVDGIAEVVLSEHGEPAEVESS